MSYYWRIDVTAILGTCDYCGRSSRCHHIVGIDTPGSFPRIDPRPAPSTICADQDDCAGAQVAAITGRWPDPEALDWAELWAMADHGAQIGDETGGEP